VFPAPGALTRFKRAIPRSRSELRFCSAIRSFFARMAASSAIVRASAWSCRRLFSQPHVAHIRHLDFFDAELLAREPREIGAPAGASSEGLLERDLGAARLAASASRHLANIEQSPVERRPLGAEVEAEAKGIGQDRGELPDHERDAPD